MMITAVVGEGEEKIGRSDEVMTHCFSERLWAIIHPCYEPPFLRVVDSCNTSTSEVLDELSKSHPASGVHVHVELVRDVFLVDLVCTHALCTKSIEKKGVRKGFSFSQKGR